MKTLEELQKEIGEWHWDTFGPCSNKRIARKLLEESAELMVKPDDWSEYGDVLMCLMALAYRNGIDLAKVVSSKFEIVKTRDNKERSK